MTRAAAALLSVGLLALVLEPLVRPPYDDGFPLSTYPMFATPRPTKLTLPYAIGVTTTGRRNLTPGLVGSGEILQALSIVQRATGQGTKATQELCKQIAARVAVRRDFADVTDIKIVVGTHDAVDFLVRGARGPELERARCKVVR